MKKLLLVLCSIGVSIGAGAQPGEVKGISLDSLKKPFEFSGPWQYHAGDNPVWALPNVDDRAWQPTSSVIDWNVDTAPPFDGIGWFRTRFRIDSSLTEVPLAFRMEHTGASEVYLNGKKLVSFGEIKSPDSTRYYDPQRAPYALTLPRAGVYLLAVRYADWDAHKNYHRRQEFGGPGFKLTLSQANDAYDYEFTQAVGATFAFQSLFMLFATMGIVHLLFWLYNRRIVSNLLFSIFSISLSLCILTDLLAFLTHSPTTIWFSRIYSPYIILVCCVSLSAFINSLFGKHGTRFRSIAGYAILLAGLYAFDVPGLNAFAKPLFFGAIALETITLTLRAIFRGVKGARIIGAGMLCFAAFALVTALIALVSKQPLSFDEHTAIGHVILVSITASIVAMPVSMSAYLAWNFSNVNKRLQRELMQVETLSERARQQEEEKRRLLESRQEELEREVTVRTEEIRNQKKKSDDLLLNILPEEVAEELKEKGSAEARHFNDVSVLFTDFVDFTKHSEMLTPAAIVAELHTCFKAFDEITTRYGLEKIKTIGDAYMAVAGVPVPQQGHAAATVQAALDILDYIARRRKDFPSSFDIRIGVHSGPVVAGIVGVKKFAYDIWGDTVNTAARMQQSAEPGKINVSQSTYDQIKDYYQCSFRGEIAAKNKGNMRMYFVDSKVSELVGEPL